MCELTATCGWIEFKKVFPVLNCCWLSSKATPLVSCLSAMFGVSLHNLRRSHAAATCTQTHTCTHRYTQLFSEYFPTINVQGLPLGGGGFEVWKKTDGRSSPSWANSMLSLLSRWSVRCWSSNSVLLRSGEEHQSMSSAGLRPDLSEDFCRLCHWHTHTHKTSQSCTFWRLTYPKLARSFVTLYSHYY